MEAGGVETVRVPFDWAQIELADEYWAWEQFDRIVAAASYHGVRVLPSVYGAASWLHSVQSHPPLDDRRAREQWRSFLVALVARYGPGGSFTRSARTLPIRRWQIWNEPNFDLYWHPRPAPAEYARLLRISAGAVRRADPRAKLVTAGFAPIRSGITWWRYLPALYRIPGFARSFDVLALHPYSRTVANLRDQLRRARLIMERQGDGEKAIALTELGWSSGVGHVPLVVGPREQASNLTKSFALAERREYGISDLFWYAWQDATIVEPFCGFCPEAGLFDLDGRPKPAWVAFRRVAR